MLGIRGPFPCLEQAFLLERSQSLCRHDRVIDKGHDGAELLLLQIGISGNIAFMAAATSLGSARVIFVPSCAGVEQDFGPTGAGNLAELRAVICISSGGGRRQLLRFAVTRNSDRGVVGSTGHGGLPVEDGTNLLGAR